jgi:hypothetical protein
VRGFLIFYFKYGKIVEVAGGGFLLLLLTKGARKWKKK